MRKRLSLASPWKKSLLMRASETEKALRTQRACDPFAEQRHLDPGTIERAYWHHGYLAALRDVLALTGNGEGDGR
jgi:hypothetical protein